MNLPGYATRTGGPESAERHPNPILAVPVILPCPVCPVLPPSSWHPAISFHAVHQVWLAQHIVYNMPAGTWQASAMVRCWQESVVVRCCADDVSPVYLHS